MVKGHHLQLMSHPSLVCNFKHFNIEAATAHHPVTWKEVDELLAKGATEPATGGAGFYSNILVVPKHTGGLWSKLNLLTFKIPTIRQVWQLIQLGDYVFSIDLKDVYLHIPIVENHCNFLHFVWKNKTHQWKVLSFGLDFISLSTFPF